MSLLRRKRRQNRMAQQAVPATRETRFSLEPLDITSQIRGLRNIHTTYVVNRNLRVLRRSEQKRLRKIKRSLNPFEIAQLKTNTQLNNVVKFNERNTANGAKATLDTTTGKITVDLPSEHKICKERQARREVLFAENKAGKGGQKPRRKDNNIELRCK